MQFQVQFRSWRCCSEMYRKNADVYFLPPVNCTYSYLFSASFIFLPNRSFASKETFATQFQFRISNRCCYFEMENSYVYFLPPIDCTYSYLFSASLMHIDTHSPSGFHKFRAEYVIENNVMQESFDSTRHIPCLTNILDWRFGKNLMMNEELQIWKKTANQFHLYFS